jgi:hypothetical protein
MQLSDQSFVEDDEDWSRPGVAYSTSDEHYLVVAHNDYAGGQAIYGRTVSTKGVRLSWESVFYTAAKDAIQPDVAYNATEDEYLVVWMYDANGDGETFEIWGRILPPIAHPAAFKIISWSHRSFWSPRVVWNSARNEYFVVWNAWDVSGGVPGLPNDVSGYRIGADGNVINEGSPVVISSADYPHQVDVAYSTGNDEYLVVWARAYAAPTTDYDIYGARVTWDGSVVSPGAFAICSAAGHQNTPAVAYDRRQVPIIEPPWWQTVERYMVVWEDDRGGAERDILGRELDGDANPGDFVAFVAWAGDDRAPDVARSSLATEGIVFGDPTGWLVVWQHETSTGWAVWGLQEGPGTTDAAFQVASRDSWDYRQPTLALAADHRLLIAYEGESSVQQQIYGRLEWPGGLTTFLPMAVRGS